MLKPKKKLTRREIKQDKLVTTWFKAIDYVNQHSRELLYGGVAVIAIITAVTYYNYHKQQQEQMASLLFAHGQSAYADQNYDAAVDSLVRLVNEYGGTYSASVGTIYLANTFMHKKDFEVAEQYYRAYLDDYDDDPVLSVTAAAGIAATYDERGDYAKAAELYEKAARDYEDSYRAAELWMRAARCYHLAEQPDNSRRALAALLEKYPESSFTQDAKLLQAELGS